MLSVPKKANDAMHLSLLEGCDVPTDSLGEVVLQDSFHVWDSRQIIRKGRERRAFLFDLHLLLAKEVKDSHGKAKYIFKCKFMVNLFPICGSHIFFNLICTFCTSPEKFKYLITFVN